MATAASPKPPEPPKAESAPASKPGLKQRILANLPGTAVYEQRRNEAVAAIEKSLIDSLRAIFPDDQPEEEPRLRFTDEGIRILFAAKAARLSFWRKELGDWLLWAFVAGAILTTVVVCFIARQTLHIHQSWSGWGWTLLATAALTGACLLCMAVPGMLFTKFYEESFTGATQNVAIFGPIAFFVLACLIGTHYLRLSVQHPGLILVIQAAVFVFTMFIAVSVTWLLGMILLLDFLKRQIWRAHPSVSIFAELLSLLPLRVATFQHLDQIAQVMSSLERVAFLMEGPLVQRLHTGDPETQRWLEREMKGHAAAIREWKTLAIYSRGTVPEQLNLNLEDTLRHFCNLRWDLLEKAPVPVISKRERARRFGERALNALTVSILPASLLAIRLFVPAVERLDQKNIVLLGALIWLCFNLLSIVDPEYSLTKQTLDLAGKFRALAGGGHDSSSGAEEH